MSVLSPELRKRLEDACIRARRSADGACRASLGSLGVTETKVPGHLSEQDRILRRALRAKGRQLGDLEGSMQFLVAECAYEQWHRLLFVRFLAENGLLIHPVYGVAVSLNECEELAEELGEPDGWGVAGRFASEILPGIFRLDDPCVQMRLAPEGRVELESVVASLPVDVFIADDALGWVYQFWQKEKKDEINASERKVGGPDLGPVTQLFTENYMVRFLLENSLGAWWAARHPESSLIKEWEYLRLDEHGSPAAGRFETWPDRVEEVTVMDPCCGSGHFLVEAFTMLWRMRVEEDGLPAVAAQDAVLRDNIFGLEIDPRCVQIAMFAIVITAWKAGGGWRRVPTPNIACSGIGVHANVDEWTKLAGGEARLEEALRLALALFRDADSVGSLSDVARTLDEAGLYAARFDEVQPLLEKVLERERNDPAASVLGQSASGVLRAISYLARRYQLVATNPPFLNLARASSALRSVAATRYGNAKNELATVFLSRAAELTTPTGSYALVIPQNYLFLGSYRKLRELNLSRYTWNAIARVGPGGFAGITGEVVNVVLAVCSVQPPRKSHRIMAVDIQRARSVVLKSVALRENPIIELVQSQQLQHPEARFIFGEVDDFPMLAEYVETSAGIQTGDYPRFGRFFWEIPELGDIWSYQQGTVLETIPYGGREHVVRWEDGDGELLRFVTEKLGDLSPNAWLRGTHFQGREGVAIKLMGDLPATRFEGTLFDNNVGVVIPRNPSDLPALWAFCTSPQFVELVRTFNPSMKAEPSALAKIPVDMAHWSVASESTLMPERWSDDPTQWLFQGRPEASSEPLQVAVARLLGYHWPEQAELDDLDALADHDGIVSLPSVVGEPPAADRLQELLAHSFGDSWSPSLAMELLADCGSRKKDLESWLRDDFFKAHCQLFRNRPFVWHIWDGHKNGFSALVNYHRLDRPTLEKLTYTYLGDWIERQAAGVRDDVAGAEDKLVAARDLQRRLELILEGESPFDIFVRWKTLADQPIGWNPDLDDGIRLNVRPFVEADVLRSKFNVKWDKDRGKNFDGSDRHNDGHFTLADKQALLKKSEK